jgi:hypothetical protein
LCPRLFVASPEKQAQGVPERSEAASYHPIAASAETGLISRRVAWLGEAGQGMARQGRARLRVARQGFLSPMRIWICVHVSLEYASECCGVLIEHAQHVAAVHGCNIEVSGRAAEP